MKGTDWRGVTEDQIAAHITQVAEGRTARRLPGATPRRNKFNAQKTTVDGHVFDSKAEAAYYHQLKLRLKAGEIRDLKIHPVFPLYAQSQEFVSELVGEFEADFEYQERVPGHAGHGGHIWERRVDDCKGAETLALAKWKQKHLKIQTGIVVREIR